MRKIIIFDSGYGGELFADWLEEQIPILDIIRVIDWRNANSLLKSPKEARRVAINALAPYLGKVDLIIFANHLLTLTSLRYFHQRYPNQKFIGLDLPKSEYLTKRKTLILTTRALANTIKYKLYSIQLLGKSKTLCLDSWPELIDDGELTESMVTGTLDNFISREKFHPEEIILACTQFQDIKSILNKFFSRNVKIYDGYEDVYRQICKILRIRGGAKKYK